MLRSKNPGSVIFEARKVRGYTQADLQRKTGLSYNTIANAERGVFMSLRTADKIGKALGIEFSEQLSREDKGKTAGAVRRRRKEKKRYQARVRQQRKRHRTHKGLAA